MSAIRSTYNLLDEEWISVLNVDGSAAEVSLLQAFAQAETIAQIMGETSTICVAIEGLLQAVYRRATWQQYAEAEDLDEQIEIAIGHLEDWDAVAAGATEYLETYRERFDLRHPVEPFFQVADLRTSKDAVSGLEVLFADVPNGSPLFSMRLKAGLARMSWAEAARWALHVHAFDPSGIRSGAVGDPRVKGGKGYPIGPGWSGQLGVYTPYRSNLKETLLLSAAPTGVGGLDYDIRADLPPWERPQLSEKEDGGRPPEGPVDAATWQTRRIRLVGDDQGVTGVVLAQGDRLTPQNRYTVEPRSAWRFSKPQTAKFKQTVYMPRELDPSTSMWRGLEALFPDTAKAVDAKTSIPRYLPPAISVWISELAQAAPGLVSRGELRMRAVGEILGSNQSVIDEIVTDELVFPISLMEANPLARACRARAIRWIVMAEEVSRAVGDYAANLARAAGARETDALRDSVRFDFLAAAEPIFRSNLRELGLEDPDAEDLLTPRWANSLRSLAYRLRDERLQTAGPAALIGREESGRFISAGLAEKYLLKKLNLILGSTTISERQNPDE